MTFVNRLKVYWPSVVVVVFALLITITAVILSFSEFGDQKSEIIRNYSLIIIATWGVALGLWRSQIANDQARTSESGLRNERYQKGADMLGSNTLSVRVAGIYALERLAQDHPDEFHIQIMRLLSIFVRHPGPDFDAPVDGYGGGGGFPKGATPRDGPDINAVADVIRRRSPEQIRIERKQCFNLDFSGASFHGADLRGADFTGANFEDAVLSFSRLAGAAGLTQEMLNSAHPSAPPQDMPTELLWPFVQDNGNWIGPMLNP